MKRTLQKFTISNRLDAKGSKPQRIIEDPELARFECTIQSVDARLRAGRTPAPDPPPWLRASIMNELQREHSEPPKRSPLGRIRGIGICFAVGVMLLLAAWAVIAPTHPGATPEWSAGHTDAEAVVRMAALQGAGALMEPFDAELTNLSKDLDRTTEFLRATLP